MISQRKLFLILLLLVFSTPVIADEYSITLENWPIDIAKKIRAIAPEVDSKKHDLSSLNTLIKKIDKEFNFNSLRVVQQSSLKKIYQLEGDIAPELDKITFEGLSEISETDALSLMKLNPSNLLEEKSLTEAVSNLKQYYRSIGYRSATVSYDLVSISTLTKEIRFTVDKKQRTLLNSLNLSGMSDFSLQQKFERILRRNNRKATLNQETLNKISNELRQLLSSHGYFSTSTPSPNIVFAADDLSAALNFKLTSSPRYSVEVVKTQHFSDTYLEEEILKLDSFYTKESDIASDLIERLKSFYILEGFPNIKIESKVEKNHGYNELLLEVDEGPLTTIESFKVTGQISRPESYYKKLFFDIASAKVKKEIYIKEDIENAAKNLLVSIQNDGFVNAKLTRLFVSTDRENPSIGVVVLQIDEGPKLQIADINYEGIQDLNIKNQLELITGLKKGDPLSLTGLEQSLIQLREYYLNSGYIEFQLLGDDADVVTYSENNSKATLNIKVSEGPKVLVQSILVEGNQHLIDKVILIELEFKAGEVLTPNKIDESISRLQKTGHFNSIEINTLEKNSDISQRTVLVKVVERDPGVVVFGIGVTDENRGTLHGYGGLAYRNFFNRAVGLSGRTELNYNFADIKYLEQKHTLGFVWPYLFNSRARFRTSATRANNISDFRIRKVTEANTAVFSLEQDFTSQITGALSYTVTTFKDHGISNDDELSFGYSSESLVIGSFGPSIDFDYRDNLFNPTKGSLTNFALEFASLPLGNNNVDDFIRTTAQTTHYMPIKNTQLVFVQSIRGGYIQNIDAVKNEGVPFDKRGFSLGGRTTIRGFESSEIFPTTAQIGSSYRLTTSAQYQLVKSELRFPISIKYDLAGAIFYDGGQVLVQGIEFEDPWRDAAGAGLRYNTPVGPVNLEFAFKLDKKTGESDGAFHLSVGVF